MYHGMVADAGGAGSRIAARTPRSELGSARPGASIRRQVRNIDVVAGGRYWSMGGMSVKSTCEACIYESHYTERSDDLDSRLTFQRCYRLFSQDMMIGRIGYRETCFGSFQGTIR